MAKPELPCRFAIDTNTLAVSYGFRYSTELFKLSYGFFKVCRIYVELTCFPYQLIVFSKLFDNGRVKVICLFQLYLILSQTAALLIGSVLC